MCTHTAALSHKCIIQTQSFPCCSPISPSSWPLVFWKCHAHIQQVDLDINSVYKWPWASCCAWVSVSIKQRWWYLPPRPIQMTQWMFVKFLAWCSDCRRYTGTEICMRWSGWAPGLFLKQCWTLMLQWETEPRCCLSGVSQVRQTEGGNQI